MDSIRHSGCDLCPRVAAMASVNNGVYLVITDESQRS